MAHAIPTLLQNVLDGICPVSTTANTRHLRIQMVNCYTYFVQLKLINGIVITRDGLRMIATASQEVNK